MKSNTRLVMARVMIGLIRLYRLIPKRGDHCRYHPTCSAYGLEAVQVHGALRGGWLTVTRLGRCHPWGGTGIDPVPTTAQRSTAGRQRTTSTTTGFDRADVAAGLTQE